MDIHLLVQRHARFFVLFCFVFFTYRSRCSQKNAFQNKRCCWSSLSWDSLLKNSSLLLPSFGQYQTNINNCGADVLTEEDSKAGLRHIPNQNKTPTTEINLLVWVLWDKSTFWISSHLFIKQSRGFLFICVFVLGQGQKVLLFCEPKCHINAYVWCLDFRQSKQKCFLFHYYNF